MDIRRAVAVGMTFSFMMGMTGCAQIKKSFEKSLKNPLEKYASVLEDMDFEEVEDREYRRLDKEDGDFEDGVFALSDIPKNFEGLVGDFTYSDVNGNELYSVLAARQWVEDDDHSSNFSVFVFQYEDEDDAEDFFEDLEETLGEDTDYFNFWVDYGDFEVSTDDDYYLVAGYSDVSGVEHFLRIVAYIDGDTVVVARTVSQGRGGEDFVELMDDFCDGADLENPGDLL